MAQKRQRNHTGISMGIGLGIAMSVAITALVSVVTAVLVTGGKWTEEQAIYGSVAALLLSGFSGSMLAAGMAGEKRMVVCLLHGVLYFLMLLCITALVFDGAYENLWGTLIIVLGSSTAAGLVGIKKHSVGFRGVRKHYKI